MQTAECTGCRLALNNRANRRFAMYDPGEPRCQFVLQLQEIGLTGTSDDHRPLASPGRWAFAFKLLPLAADPRETERAQLELVAQPSQYVTLVVCGHLACWPGSTTACPVAGSSPARRPCTALAICPGLRDRRPSRTV